MENIDKGMCNVGMDRTKREERNREQKESKRKEGSKHKLWLKHPL